jgi:putative colanic acid biosynthesis UDP-glucose lipid carrier transferase
VIKTIFDKIFASVVIIVLAPLLLLIALWIKLDSKGPVFYCPVRIGRSGKAFKVYKFRSMWMNDNSTKGTLSTAKDDPRITRIGRILRKYSLDELPQFFNVILGNMSVVGPRPHRRFLDRHLQETVYQYMIRHYVKPGITGWAQVNGWRGPSETDEQKMQRTKHDLFYIEHWSFWFDLKIIFLTVFSSKARSSAY